MSEYVVFDDLWVLQISWMQKYYYKQYGFVKTMCDNFNLLYT